jgi:hypothetical protein
MLVIVTLSKLKDEWIKYWSEKLTNEQAYVWYTSTVGKRPNE